MKNNKNSNAGCRIRKRPFHFYSPGVARRSHAAALHVRPAVAAATSALLLLLLLLCITNLLIRN